MHRTQRQIEQYRKGTALIQVQQQDGRPCVGAQVSVEQETHQFQFGCLVPDLSEWSSNDRERYHRRVGEVFNVVRRQDQAERAGAELLTIDLTNCRERMHLAEVRRELDKLNVASGGGKGTALEVHAYVSGSTIGSCDYQRCGGMHPDEERSAARHVAGLYTLCFSHPFVRGIFWCGISDREKRVSNGGLLRRDLSPKHAHKTLRKLIHAVWHTRACGTTDPLGGFSFHGFFGTYRIVVEVSDRLPIVHRLCLRPGNQRMTISVALVGEES